MRFTTCLALALASTFSFSPAPATTLHQLSLSDITQRAAVAVVGEVTATRSAMMADGPYTLMTIDVEQPWWGTEATTLIVAVPGGSHANAKVRVGTVMAGAAVVFKGERAVFMLTPDPLHGGYGVVGFTQGLMPLLRTAQGDAVVLPGAARTTMLPAAARSIREMRARINTR